MLLWGTWTSSMKMDPARISIEALSVLCTRSRVPEAVSNVLILALNAVLFLIGGAVNPF